MLRTDAKGFARQLQALACSCAGGTSTGASSQTGGGGSAAACALLPCLRVGAAVRTRYGPARIIGYREGQLWYSCDEGTYIHIYNMYVVNWIGLKIED